MMLEWWSVSKVVCLMGKWGQLMQRFYVQLEEAEARLQTLRSGSTLITAEERQAVEKAFLACTDAWAKRKRVFKSIWCAGSLKPILSSEGLQCCGDTAWCSSDRLSACWWFNAPQGLGLCSALTPCSEHPYNGLPFSGPRQMPCGIDRAVLVT